jgi:hypothetical protein
MAFAYGVFISYAHADVGWRAALRLKGQKTKARAKGHKAKKHKKR